MDKVRSSNIEAIGYEGTTLKVQFKTKDGRPGATYVYHDVPAHVHKELMGAESIGGYFGSYIRNNFKGKKHETVK